MSTNVIRRVRNILRLQALLCIFSLLTGCSRNPDVRKQKYLESGERFFANGDYKSASIQFRNALQADARFPAAHYQLARTYLKLQDWNRAYEELTTTIELQPENYEARIKLANLLTAAGDFKRAQAQIEVLNTQQPQNPDVHLTAAALLAAKQQLGDAIGQVERAISLDPHRGDAYTQLALLQLKNNQTQDAEGSFNKAVEYTPKSAAPLIALGSYYQTQQRFSEAQQQFQHAIDTEPQNPYPYIALARLYMAEGKKENAEDLLRGSKKRFRDNSVGYRMLGDFYFAVGDYDNALSEYGELDREHPKDPVVTKNYVQLLIIKNHLDEANRLNDAVLKARPNDVDALIGRGQIRIAQGRTSEGITALQNAIKNDPNSGPAYYQLGVAYDREKKHEQAEKAWQDAVSHRPEMLEAQRALAFRALQKGDMPRLETYASQIVNLEPTSTDGYALRALSRIRRLQLAQAEPDVQKAIAVGPESPAGYLQQGNLMLARKNYRAAEQAYREALERDSNSVDALSGLMNTYFAENQPQSAFGAAEGQITKVPDKSIFYDLLGTALFDHKRNKKDLEDAETDLERSIQFDDKNVDAFAKLVQVQAVRDSVNQAMATCQQGLEKNPGETSLYILLGELHNSKGEWDQAEHAFQKALQFSPGNPIASNDLAYAMLQTGGNPDLAMPLAETARRGLPNSPQAADTMGWALYQKGAYNSAIDQFQEALRLAEGEKSPDNPTVHYHLGLAYERAGKPALARQHLQRVLKINPDYSRAEDVKKLLSQLRG